MDKLDRNTRCLNTHIFTNVDSSLFEKHFPNFHPELGGFRFSFGLEVPPDCDVLIVYTRASYSIHTHLPPERTIFLAAEPDVIHPYSTAFLNQFGIVLSSTNKELKVEQWRTACCTLWFAGIDFRGANNGFPKEMLKGVDWFRSLEMPPKQDRISIVTSTKTFTPYHRKRLEFIDAITKIIPDRIEVFGNGFRTVDDKKDALLPYRYHLAIENGDGPDLWTEKLADSFLCGAFPFYAGCSNIENYFPNESFHYVDLNKPDEAAQQMVTMIESNHWQKVQPALAEARERILTTYNVAELFVRLTEAALAKPLETKSRKQRLIRSERSLWPEKGAKGSFGEWAVRNLLLAVDPKIELRAASLQKKLEARRSLKRSRKRIKLEATINNSK